MALPVVVVCAGLCAGCGTGSEKDGVRAAANALFRDVRNGDGHAACTRLVPRAASTLETGDTRCEQQILRLGLKGGPLGPVEVWADQARVRAGTDTVFLTRWGSGWRVTAVGCEPRDDRPYDCDVST
ncbi:hypothetical protein Acsp03_26770 [Actinomadura sp. NBRC 104412]|uniref:hypothetical protein n=1 Tax=Actinomadura sp. NBRC 104412 TaxID=3032203 RepID=UPI0024A1259F|nr:hypothetical protein [Actinomadura sp. NBRC 104412]GLZ05211.1 hypothetical protein Acsp03_26770 [Actinomadura sp. NBRC 104412]